MTFNLNALGNENTEYISEKDTKRILGKGYLSIIEYLKHLHFNEEHPENHNVYLPNWRDKSKVLTFDGNNWSLCDREETIEELKEKGISFINTNYDKLDGDRKMDIIAIKKLDRFLESYEDDDDKIKIINNNLNLLL